MRARGALSVHCIASQSVTAAYYCAGAVVVLWLCCGLVFDLRGCGRNASKTCCSRIGQHSNLSHRVEWNGIE